MSNINYGIAFNRRLMRTNPLQEVTNIKKKNNTRCHHKTAAGNECRINCAEQPRHEERCAKGAAKVRRHDKVLHALAYQIQKYTGTKPLMEQQILNVRTQDEEGQEEQGRMDIIAETQLGTKNIDVSIVSAPYNDRCVHIASMKDGHISNNAAQRKRMKYAQVQNLVPFIIESGGRYSPDARALLSWIVTHSEEEPSITNRRILKAISSTLQAAVSEQYVPIGNRNTTNETMNETTKEATKEATNKTMNETTNESNQKEGHEESTI